MGFFSQLVDLFIPYGTGGVEPSRCRCDGSESTPCSCDEIGEYDNSNTTSEPCDYCGRCDCTCGDIDY